MSELTSDDLLRALRLVERRYAVPVTTYPVIDMTSGVPAGIEDAWPDITIAPPFTEFVVAIPMAIGGDWHDTDGKHIMVAEWQTFSEGTEFDVADPRGMPDRPTFDPDGEVRWLMTVAITMVDPVTWEIGEAPGACMVRVAHDGSLIDHHWREWTNLREVLDVDSEGSAWRATMMWSYAAINFLNCRNVNLVEPQLTRAQQRRVQRAGIRVHRIEVIDPGTSTRTVGHGPGGEELPLHQVRGHFARYGPRFGRGLLFGKHEGMYWVPDHRRGSADHGEVRHQYVPRIGV